MLVNSINPEALLTDRFGTLVARGSVGKRMSNRWQMQGSYVWSRLDGDIWLDYTNPNNLLDFVGKGATATGNTPFWVQLLAKMSANDGAMMARNP